MARHENTLWSVPDPVETPEQAVICVLMDIRRELSQLNATLNCPNFLDIPGTLRDIRRKLPTQRKTR